MRVLVTGASSQLGSFLIPVLLERGHEVVGLVRPSSDLWRLTDVLDGMQLIYADLNAMESVADHIRAAQPEIVFHLAWQNTTSDKLNQIEQITVNTTASLKLFEIVQEAGCHTWVGIGSLSEYGPQDHPIDETTPPEPVTTYALAKLHTGLLTQKLCEISNIRFLWFRMTGIYGPKDNPRRLIPTVVQALLQGKRPKLTTGEQRWDYLYIADAVDALMMATFDKPVSGFYNLGFGEADSIRQIVTTIRDMIDPDLPLGFGEIESPTGVPATRLLQADPSRFQSDTEWRPEWSLAEGLQATIQWHKTNF